MFSLWGSTPSPFSSREKCISTQRSPSETQHPRILMWDWSYRLPLPRNYQSSGLLERKQVLHINRIVWINSLCIVNLLYQLENGGITVKAKSPDTSQGLTLQTNLSRDSGFKSAWLNFFCTVHKTETASSLQVTLENSSLLFEPRHFCPYHLKVLW